MQIRGGDGDIQEKGVKEEMQIRGGDGEGPLMQERPVWRRLPHKRMDIITTRLVLLIAI